MDTFQAVRDFRKGMLKLKDEGYSFARLDDFPIGCCEFSSYLLAKYLIEECKLSDLKMLRGKNRFKKKQRHVWLRSGKVDIDITANQFSSTDKTVFFEECSSWHDRYVVYEKEEPDTSFSQFHEEYKGQFIEDYGKILVHVHALTSQRAKRLRRRTTRNEASPLVAGC